MGQKGGENMDRNDGFAALTTRPAAKQEIEFSGNSMLATETGPAAIPERLPTGSQLPK
jgi:hypothetical protein